MIIKRQQIIARLIATYDNTNLFLKWKPFKKIKKKLK